MQHLAGFHIPDRVSGGHQPAIRRENDAIEVQSRTDKRKSWSTTRSIPKIDTVLIR